LLGAQASSPANCELNDTKVQTRKIEQFEIRNRQLAIGNSQIHILLN